MRLRACLVAPIALLAGCGSSGPGPAIPTVAAAKTFTLAGFQPTVPVHAGTPTTISFTVDQPSGAPLTQYRTGPGPHTGVHLIIVRRDLSTIIHTHPPIGPDGHVSESVTFPRTGAVPSSSTSIPSCPEYCATFSSSRTSTSRGRTRRCRHRRSGTRSWLTVICSRCTGRRTCKRSRVQRSR